MTEFQSVKVGVVKKWVFGFLGSGRGSFDFWGLKLVLKLGMLIFYKI